MNMCMASRPDSQVGQSHIDLGGPSNADCLSFGEAGGMGEGKFGVKAYCLRLGRFFFHLASNKWQHT